jgi:hypothetical protein
MAGAGNIFAQGMKSFDDSYDRTGQIYNDVARRRAGAALATGDRAGAARALGADGEVNAVRTLQSDQAADENTAYEHARKDRDDATAANEHSAKALLEALDHVRRVPLEQRERAMHHPIWRGLGVTEQMLANMKPEDLTDEAIAQFRDRVLQIVNRGGGGYDVVDKDTGDLVRGVEPTRQKPPAGQRYNPETGELEVDPLAVAFRVQTRAPPRARAATPGPGGSAPAGDLGPITWHK